MSVCFSEIIAAAHLRKASLAAEVAGYLALSVADQVQGAPRRATSRDIALQRDGGVRVNGGSPVNEVEAEAALRELLLCLLEQASSVTPALVKSGKRQAQHGVETLIRELETALIPVNRGAAKRALARLYRDVNRVRESGVSLEIEIPARVVAAPPASVLPPPALEPVKSMELPEVMFSQAMEPSLPPAPVVPAVLPPMELNEALVTAEPVEVDIPIDVFSPTPPPMMLEEIDVELDVETSEIVVAAPAPAPAPEVPDLELPAAETAPRNEPATVPQPAVRRSRNVEAVHRTPVLGTRVEPAHEPALILTDADITDPVPSAEAPCVMRDEPEPQVHTLEIPEVEAAPEPVFVEAAAPEVPAVTEPEPEPEPLPEPRLDHTQLLPPVEVVAREPLPEPEVPEPTPPPPPRELTPPPEIEFLEGETVLAAADDEDDAIPFELTSRTPPPAEVSCVDDFPLELTQSAELDEEEDVDSQWDESAVRLELQEALPDIDVHELQTLADLPPRPLPGGHAAPRYAPRRSDVSELLSGFGVGEKASDRELCRDLKLLAGIENTSAPPEVSLSETPPPVAVTMDDEGAGPRREDGARIGSRALIGAAVVGLVVAGVGFGSIPLQAGTPVAAAATVPSVTEPVIRMGESEREPPCAAEIAVTDVPARARVELRAGPDGEALQPKHTTATGVVFAGLPCREAVDVMLELPGRRWLRVPVAASELTPSDAEPALVRHSVAAR